MLPWELRLNIYSQPPKHCMAKPSLCKVNSVAMLTMLLVIEVDKNLCRIFLTTGCLGNRDPRLQPDDLATGRGSHGYSKPNEAFLPQLRVPASPTALFPVASPSTSLHRAVLHFGTWWAPRLLQHPYDTAEWTGRGKANTVFFSFAVSS